MQTSRSVTIPTGFPSPSITGRLPQSPSHIFRAASLSESSGLHVWTVLFIIWATFILFPPASFGPPGAFTARNYCRRQRSQRHPRKARRCLPICALGWPSSHPSRESRPCGRLLHALSLRVTPTEKREANSEPALRPFQDRGAACAPKPMRWHGARRLPFRFLEPIRGRFGLMSSVILGASLLQHHELQLAR